VSALNAEQGGLISTSSPCAVLAQPDDAGVEIAVTVRESALKKVKVGQAVTVSGVAFSKKSYNGTLTYLSPTARTRLNGTVTETVVDAVVTIDEEELDESLLVGLSAKASITVDVKPNVLVVPYDCLMQDDDGNAVVYTIGGNTASRRVIKIGKETASGVEVLDGLSEGAVVVKDPERLSGETVIVKTEGT
ncbi:MAG: efflux RND transporter periplasmic adaptor subunit, partial [Clostridia bacterium]|nr:efflux RND transporter periplasmic adaptor subunit [Clostridia bacterium]